MFKYTITKFTTGFCDLELFFNIGPGPVQDKQSFTNIENAKLYLASSKKTYLLNRLSKFLKEINNMMVNDKTRATTTLTSWRRDRAMTYVKKIKLTGLMKNPNGGTAISYSNGMIVELVLRKMIDHTTMK